MIRIAAYEFLLWIFGISRSGSRLWWPLVLLLGLSIIYPIISILEVLLICRPLAAQWDADAGTCGNQKISFLAIEIAGLILDLPLFLIPAMAVSKLDILGRKKVAIILVFQIGSMSVKPYQLSDFDTIY
jgi:hypothetical protein